jgi:hypothetical protein
MSNAYDDWFAVGEKFLQEWRDQLAAAHPTYNVTLNSNEEDAYMLAWEQAGRELGVIE